MDGIDATTWQALGLTLSLVGLLVSALVWRRHGPGAGLRGVAWSLLPAAAGLTGILRLLYQIGDSVVAWALRLVFSPVVWVGLVLAGVSVLLFGVSGVLRARGVGRRTREDAGPGDRGGQARSLSPKRSTSRAKPAVRDEDMDDIEAILRKHGIS